MRIRPHHSAALALAATALLGCVANPPAPPPPPPAPVLRQYPLHSNITATVFWVGEPGSSASIPNLASAWDDLWQQHFGGIDDPRRRHEYAPAGFVPRENPFYFALPYNDLAGGHRKPKAMTVIPWANGRPCGPHESLCKNRWIRITRGPKTCYAQWEDVGPFRTDEAAYVFGTAAPQNHRNQQAGLDVSPAVRDYLAIGGMDRVDWQFVEPANVPDGPWKRCITTSQICWR